MRVARWISLGSILLVVGLAGCSLADNTGRQPALNTPGDLARLQNQIYDAATGPNHVGSVYRP